jgi:GT2 family glycosyltransferase
LALTAPTPYIIVLDDDRFPNEDFVKRTREVLDKKDCIVGQYGWILDDIKMDINGLFVFPNWMMQKKQKGISFNYNKVNLYSNNIKQEWNNMTIPAPENYVETNMIYHSMGEGGSNDKTLLSVDYLCGGMSFRKSTLCKLFNSEISTVDTGEDIMFCLKAKKQGIPVFCLAPEYKELLFADDRNISSTSSLTILKKRTQIIRELLK